MPSALSLIVKLIDYLTQFTSSLAALGLALIVGSYVFEVISRYIFEAPTAWASDFVAYALCATVFLALPRVTKERSHVAVTIIVELVPNRVADLVHIAVNILGFASLSFATWISLQENIRQFSRDIHTLAIVPIPQWWVSSFITFGLALSACYFLFQISPRFRLSGSNPFAKADG